jgi:hypothetical protein
MRWRLSDLRNKPFTISKPPSPPSAFPFDTFFTGFNVTTGAHDRVLSNQEASQAHSRDVKAISFNYFYSLLVASLGVSLLLTLIRPNFPPLFSTRTRQRASEYYCFACFGLKQPKQQQHKNNTLNQW